MIGTSLELNRNQEGEINYRGNSSGSVFAQEASHIIQPNRTDILTEIDNRDQDSPILDEEDEEIDLPPVEVARVLSQLCCDNACGVVQFFHWPSYLQKLESFYAGQQDDDFLPVLYSTMTVGCLFAKDIAKQLGIEDLRIRAYQYFQASKRHSNPLDRASTEVLQTLILQVLFLHSTANLSSCWTYLGTAMRCAQRMGLHRNLGTKFNPIEHQVRIKMFWAIRNLDTYLHAVLGFPRGISDQDFDQLYIAEVDDTYITSDQLYAQPLDIPCSVTCTNVFSRLMTILGDLIPKVYPIHTPSGQTYVSDHDIQAIEYDLQQWQESVPPYLQDTTRSNAWCKQARMLQYTYSHTRIFLYRPFLHYITDQENEFRVYAQHAKESAFAILALTEDLLNEDPACLGHLISIYSTFFSGMILLYCVIQEPHQSDRNRCLHAIDVALKAMEFCSSCSYAAERCRDVFIDMKGQIPSELYAVKVDEPRFNYSYADFIGQSWMEPFDQF